MPLTQVNNDVLEAATVQSIRDSIFVAGTRIGFQQTSAPTGWTKDTTAAMNDSIMRIVTGSAGNGGSTVFSSWAGTTAVGATTLTSTQIPSHTHSYTTLSSSYAQSGSAFGGILAGSASSTTGSLGGGGSHNHSVNNNIKYYDFIIASKD